MESAFLSTLLLALVCFFATPTLAMGAWGAGDTVALLFGLFVIFILLCAFLGWWSRRSWTYNSAKPVILVSRRWLQTDNNCFCYCKPAHVTCWNWSDDLKHFIFTPCWLHCCPYFEGQPPWKTKNKQLSERLLLCRLTPLSFFFELACFLLMFLQHQCFALMPYIETSYTQHNTPTATYTTYSHAHPPIHTLTCICTHHPHIHTNTHVCSFIHA